MVGFSTRKFIGKMAGLLKSPAETIKTAIDEKDYATAAASVACGNIILGLILIFFCVFAGIERYSGLVFKGVITFDVVFAAGVLCYFVGGRLTGGKGSIRNVAVACAFVSIPIFALKGVLPVLTFIAAIESGGKVMALIPIWKWVTRFLSPAINFYAVKQSHELETTGNVVAALVVSEILIIATTVPIEIATSMVFGARH